MHKQTDNNVLLKKPTRQTRLNAAPVFNTYKLNNEKAKANVIYRGALAWNALSIIMYFNTVYIIYRPL